LQQILAGLRIALMALRYRADAVVVASGAAHWFSLSILPRLGIPVIPAVHCVLWPKYRRPGLVGRLVNALNARFFRRHARLILTASADIDEQLTEMAGKDGLQLIPFLPTYRAGAFAAAVDPPPAAPFRVLYAGRIEPDKGVFDLLVIAQALPEIEFNVCGTGSALDELRRRSADIADRFRLHGHCDRPTMSAFFRNCHAVIVPTTSRFVEGFNQVVAEGILASRPVVTSSVCPAVRYVGDAVVAVPPDDVAAYVAAIRRLTEDRNFYDRCRAQCAAASAQFLDPARSWGAALETALSKIRVKESQVRTSAF
jgi:glycosyltransferase involved in cell wall biosynthesis